MLISTDIMTLRIINSAFRCCGSLCFQGIWKILLGGLCYRWCVVVDGGGWWWVVVDGDGWWCVVVGGGEWWWMLVGRGGW